MKAIPHSHILVVWPGSDPFPSDSPSLSPCFSLSFAQTQTQHHLRCFLPLTQAALLIKAMFSTLASLLLCQGNGVVTLCVTQLKRGRPALLLKAVASTREDVPGLIRRRLQGGRAQMCLHKQKNRRSTLPWGGRRIIWLEGRGAANKPRSVRRSRRQSGHQVEEKTSPVWSRLLIVEGKIGARGRGTPCNRELGVVY